MNPDKDELIKYLLKMAHTQQALIIKMNDREIFPNTPEFFEYKTRIDNFQRNVDDLLGKEK